MAKTRIPLDERIEREKQLKEKLKLSVSEIGLNVRTSNALEGRGICTLEDLLKCTQRDLLSISNFGEKSLEEVYQRLADLGFSRTRSD